MTAGSLSYVDGGSLRANAVIRDVLGKFCLDVVGTSPTLHHVDPLTPSRKTSSNSSRHSTRHSHEKDSTKNNLATF